MGPQPVIPSNVAIGTHELCFSTLSYPTCQSIKCPGTSGLVDTYHSAKHRIRHEPASTERAVYCSAADNHGKSQYLARSESSEGNRNSI